MIGRIHGTILEKQPPQLVVNVNGIGYEIQAPMSTFYQLPEINEQVTLFTHFVVREDAQLLYGFAHEQERALFRALIKVNGVGPKLGITILSGIEPDTFVQCVRNEDASSLVGIPGIGKKTAERLIIETRDALSQWEVSTPEQIDGLQEPSANQMMQDAMSALAALGYKTNDAKRAINAIAKPDHSSEELIRLALQQMAR